MVKDLIKQVASTGRSLRQELRARHRDGHEFEVDATFALIRTERHSDSQIVCSIHDISAQKELESGLRMALDRERELAMRHTLKTFEFAERVQAPLVVL